MAAYVKFPHSTRQDGDLRRRDRLGDIEHRRVDNLYRAARQLRRVHLEHVERIREL